MSQDKTTFPPPTRTRYGLMHPERVENDVWEQAIREDWSGYRLGERLGIEREPQFRHRFSHSGYRDTDPGPFWSWQRFGRTSTPLPDGRVIHVAGEHEDSYDADFCIYNDVMVEYPDGRREFYLYPKEVFPPTDSHTATLIGDEILLIGSLGYGDLRRPGETQVLTLDTRTLRIEPVATKGDGPGWISRHLAERIGEARILVIGGRVQTLDDYEPNTGVFELDLTTMTWHRRDHGDITIFPVSDAVYRGSKNPRYGTTNPERSGNPFWLEMARRRWPPSRARLHFGDFAPPQPELVWSDGKPDLEGSKLVRTIDDVVWTAVREDALRMALPDGRTLLIGGEVPDYGDEYADPWVYNDVVVSHPGEVIDILIYPKEIFPHLRSKVGALCGRYLYLFGIVDRERHPDRSRGPAVMRLDTSSYEIAELPAAAPSARVNVYEGGAYRTGNRIVFPLVRDRNSDPKLDIAFDLETLAWSEPFAHPHRPDGEH